MGDLGSSVAARAWGAVWSQGGWEEGPFGGEE